MNSSPIQTYCWREIEQTATSGVYAWYARINISRADVQQLITDVEQLINDGDHSGARKTIEAGLDKYVFSPYKESPYQVELRGPLKPKYLGHIDHKPSRSDSLVERIIERPERFRKISEILGHVAPAFTAPLYIGMAENLKARLKNHKRRIQELQDGGVSPSTESLPGAGFGNQLVYRGFDPTNLFVLIAEVPLESTEHNDIENILNRINFPIFGRN